jgi:hypothetical protein
MQGLHVATGLPVARFGRKAVVMKISGSGVIGAMLRSSADRLELIGHLVQRFAAAMSSGLIALLLVIGDGSVRTELESLARC